MVLAGGARRLWKPSLLRVVGVLAGIGLLAAGLLGARETLLSRSWTSAPGRIVVSQGSATASIARA